MPRNEFQVFESQIQLIGSLNANIHAFDFVKQNRCDE